MRYALLLLSILLMFMFIPIIHPATVNKDPVVEIAITETYGVSRYNYTIPIILDSNNFQYWNLINKTNVYFTLANGTPLYYWIESLSVAPGAYYAKFWVKIPYIPAYGTVYIYMHFGGANPYLSYKSPRNVFIFWRGFAVGLGANATTYLTDSSSSYVSVSGGKLYMYMNGTNTYGSVMVDWYAGVSLQDVQVIVKAYWEYANEQYPIVGVFLDDGSILPWYLYTGYTAYLPNYGYMYMFFAYNSTICILNNTVTSLVRDSSVSSGYSYDVVFTRLGASLIGQNGIDTLTAYDYTYSNMTHVGLFLWSSNLGSTSYVELVVNWIAIRRYIAPDPMITVVNGTTTVVTTTGATTTYIQLLPPVVNETFPSIPDKTIDLTIFACLFTASLALLYIFVFTKHRRNVPLAFISSLALLVATLVAIYIRHDIVYGYIIVNGTKQYIYKTNPLLKLYYGIIVIVSFTVIYVIVTELARKLEKFRL